MINYSLYWLNCKFIEIIDLGYRLGEIMMLSHLFLSQLFGIFADQKKKKKDPVIQQGNNNNDNKKGLTQKGFTTPALGDCIVTLYT